MNKLKQFWENYASLVIRFWTNQIVMSVLGISVGLALIALDILPVTIIGAVFCIGILCFLQYDMLFMFGENIFCKPKDAVRPSVWTGLKIALFGYLPTILLSLIGLVLQLCHADDGSTVVKLIYYAIHGSYMLLHSLLTQTVLNASSLFSQCMGWVCCLFYMIPVLVFSTLGYRLGSVDKPLRSFFGIKAKIKVSPDRKNWNK